VLSAPRFKFEKKTIFGARPAQISGQLIVGNGVEDGKRQEYVREPSFDEPARAC
jgi:hypothetical protein